MKSLIPLGRLARGDRIAGAGVLLTAAACGSYPRALRFLCNAAFPETRIVTQMHPERGGVTAYAARAAGLVRRLGGAPGDGGRRKEATS